MPATTQIAISSPISQLAPLPPNRRMRRRDVARFMRRFAGKDLLAALATLPGDQGLVWTNAGGAPLAFIRDPEHARQVLVTNQDNYVKGNDYRILAVLFGKGLLTNFDLAHWQRQRKLVQPLFAKRHLEPMATHMIGGGRRICVGQGFALLEGVLMAAMIAQRVRFDLVPGTQVRNGVAITLRPRGGMPMSVRERPDAPPLVR
ncbi:MAG: hypothetical protein QM679_07275 [Patulibacter sp.]